MITTYKEMSPDAFEPHPTWIIAFCPDTLSFFATNQRAFFWECEKEFATEEAAIDYFDKQRRYFIDIQNKIMSKFVFSWRITNKAYLENTEKWYEVEL